MKNRTNLASGTNGWTGKPELCIRYYNKGKEIFYRDKRMKDP